MEENRDRVTGKTDWYSLRQASQQVLIRVVILILSSILLRNRDYLFPLLILISSHTPLYRDLILTLIITIINIISVASFTLQRKIDNPELPNFLLDYFFREDLLTNLNVNSRKNDKFDFVVMEAEKKMKVCDKDGSSPSSGSLSKDKSVVEQAAHDRREPEDEDTFTDSYMRETSSVFKRSMWRCFNFCYLFCNFEFDKDDLVRLWIAQGFILNDESNDHQLTLEDIGTCYFDTFLSESLLHFSRLSCSTGRPRYKLNQSILHLLQEQPNHLYCRIQEGKPVSVSENTLHCSLLCDNIDASTFKCLYHSKTLQTLLLLRHHSSGVDQIARDLFLELGSLRALDLSNTNFTELPSSVVNLKDLRYLNLSGTPIKRLPESLCNLHHLQTLVLRDCLEHVSLPKGMRKLFNLRHLDVDVACLLVSMPPGLGDLTQLQTLPAFVVGKENGLHIVELKHMVYLRGNLCIVKLENISNSKEAKEAALNNKYLQLLELQWTELQDGFELLENLQPHSELKELQIVGYGGAKFPSWMGDPSFCFLETITIHDCRNCEIFPPLGKLPVLKLLRICEMPAVKTINSQFCGRGMVTGLLGLGKLVLDVQFKQHIVSTAFPRLENLKLNGMSNLEKWSGIQQGDLPLLKKLNISCFSKLTALPELSYLKSLQKLEISLCPVLQSFPKKGLPTSLHSLLIIDCPMLKEGCKKEEGREWGKISRIPNIWIDYQQIL